VLDAFAKGFAQITDAETRGVVWLSAGFSLGVIVALLFSVGFLLDRTTLLDIGWLDTVIDLLGGLAALVIAWMLFPAVVSACVGMLLERVADAVERRHYPLLAPVRDVPLGEVAGTTIRFLVILVLLNLVILLFLLVPPLFPLVFYTVNGYLVGREYFELVAQRRLDPDGVRDLRRAKRLPIFFAGVITTFLLTLPLVNLLAPIVGTAAMVHLFETWRRMP
jgi:uncharacterized protein involved in cysteine biosynthesis